MIVLCPHFIRFRHKRLFFTEVLWFIIIRYSRGITDFGFTCIGNSNTIYWPITTSVMHFMSSFFGVATVLLIVLIIVKLTRSRLAALGGALFEPAPDRP